MPITAAICALAALGAVAVSEAAPFQEPGAVLLNVTLDDLEQMFRAEFRERIGQRIEGSRAEVSRGIHDLSYHATISEPSLHIGDAGGLELELNIVEADLRVGSIERKLLRRRTRCEDAGVAVHPGRPVDVTLAFRLAVEDGDLRVVPEDVRVGDSRGFRLLKPSRCRNSLIPTWMLWWIGKPHLRKKIDGLDELLLERLQESALGLNEDGGLLLRQWRRLRLFPGSVDTSGDSVLVSMTGSEGGSAVPAPRVPSWARAEARHSFLGLSESFVNAILRESFDLAVPEPRRPGGGLRKLFKSHAIYSLIPGLRELGDREGLRFTFRFRRPPLLEFGAEPREDLAVSGEDVAVIQIHMSGLEIDLWNVGDGPDEHLGTLEVADGRVGVVPYLNVTGGVSFRLVENVWTLASSGIEFDEELVAATIQELVFGEAFETSYEPIGRGAITVGATTLEPRYFRPVDGYLVVGIAP